MKIIFENIMNKIPNEGTRKIYRHHLLKLNNNTKINNIKFLSDYNAIFDTIEKYKFNTQKSIYYSILFLLNNINDSKYDYLYNIYLNQLINIKTNYIVDNENKED